MKRSSRAWLLLPVIVVVIAVVGWLVSSYQKEAGIIDATKGGPRAVSAALVARDYSQGQTSEDYRAYADALLVAEVARRNLPMLNPADTRVAHVLMQALDCLYAAREAWQADIDAAWDPAIQGVPTYWQALHPNLELSARAAPTPADIRRQAGDKASEYLLQAIDLVS
jgi:hypothetical protein